MLRAALRQAASAARLGALPAEACGGPLCGGLPVFGRPGGAPPHRRPTSADEAAASVSRDGGREGGASASPRCGSPGVAGAGGGGGWERPLRALSPLHRGFSAGPAAALAPKGPPPRKRSALEKEFDDLLGIKARPLAFADAPD